MPRFAILRPPGRLGAGDEPAPQARNPAGRPPFRPASQREQSGPNRRVWVLKNGTPAAVPVVVGVSDGQRTEIVKGEIKEGQAVIVDSTTAKR